MNITNEQISKFKVKLYKHFSECNEYNKEDIIKVAFIMGFNNVIGIEIKNDILKEELIGFFNKNTTNNINISYMDNNGSFFDISLLKYCIELINIFQNKKSKNTLEKGIFILSGHNKPITLENEFIKIYLCNIHSEEYY